MTDEQMAAALRARGWRVRPPLTQDNCPHTNTRGSIQCGVDGFVSEWWCIDCGKHNKSVSLPTREQWSIMSAIPMNSRPI